MSKLNEIIVSQLPTQSEVLPCTAYLLDNGDGTHDRYVSDEDGILSKQSGGIKSIQPGDNITIDNTDPKNPIISSSTNETDPIFMASPSATITNSDITNWNNKLSSEVDTLESVVNRGNYSSKPISFTGVDNNVGSLWYNPSTLSYIFNSSNKQFVGVKNVLMGANTGAMLDTGGSNSIYGHNAGYALTTGSSNSLFGNAAGQGNQNGSTYMYSTFIGAYAGFKSVNGKYNSFVGYNSGGSNTGGDYNTFLGSYAGYYNISGFGNLFLGGGSAFIFKYGNSNVVIGQGSGGSKNNDISTPSNRNIYIGRLAGSGVIGDNNVFIGTQAGFVPGSGTTRTVSNKLIIHNRNGFITSEDDPAATTNTEDTFNTGLITGDFSERWIKFNGKFIVNGSYMPNATGDSTYTKNIVAKPNGDIGWDDRLIQKTYNIQSVFGDTTSIKVVKTGKEVVFNFNRYINSTELSTALNGGSSFVLCTLPTELRHNVTGWELRTFIQSYNGFHLAIFFNDTGQVWIYPTNNIAGSNAGEGQFNLNISYQVP